MENNVLKLLIESLLGTENVVCDYEKCVQIKVLELQNGKKFWRGLFHLKKIFDGHMSVRVLLCNSGELQIIIGEQTEVRKTAGGNDLIMDIC